MKEVANFWPAWLAVVIASLVMLNQMITESEKFANMLGGWARKLHERAKRRYKMDTIEFNEAVRQAVASERQRWESDEARALKAVEGQLTFVAKVAEDQQKQLNNLNWAQRCLTAYTEYEAQWHHKLRMAILKAEQNGGHLPVDAVVDHIHYAEFEERCRKSGNMNWRAWDIANGTN